VFIKVSSLCSSRELKVELLESRVRSRRVG
jgi:hypothetical protein